MDEANFPWAEFLKRAITYTIRIIGWPEHVSSCPGSLGFRYNALKKDDWELIWQLINEGVLQVVPWTDGMFFFGIF